MPTKRATKTSTLGALRSVNQALRIAVNAIEQRATGHVEHDERGHAVRWIEEPFSDEELAARCELALAWLGNAEQRIAHARNHVLSYQHRLNGRAVAERQRIDDDDRRAAEGDEQRDYAEERFNADLLTEE